MKKKVFILILLLVIGFATVSTTLILKSNVDIGANKSDFDVIFTEALLNGNNKDETFLVYDKKEITFQTEKLKNVGDKSRLDYKVKNNSTQYGAKVTINCNTYGNEYVSVEGEFDGNKFPLTNPIEMEAQEIKTGYLKAEMIKSYTGEDDAISITCTITANATEKEEIIEYVPIPYKEELLNGADPVIKDGLIPVTISDNGTVTYADIEEKWYDYENKEWANAVILEEGTSGYKKGDVIPEEKIESYFVWIPRYRYQLWDLGNYTEVISGDPMTSSNTKKVEIIFESKDKETKDTNEGECTTPMVSGVSGNCKVGDYMTHPAFLNFDVNGIWVGKFETGYKGANTKADALKNEINSSAIIVKPDVYAWCENTMHNFFKSSYNYKREYDSHMMKNTEWGAVAYLSHSKYGINTEIRINNNIDNKTGYSSPIIPSCNYGDFISRDCNLLGTTTNETKLYNSTIGYLASTTGNITGIYDMSGGISEITASYVDGYGTKTSLDVYTGFAVEELNVYSRYLDKYKSNSTWKSYNNRILGDATGELGPFFHILSDNTKYPNGYVSKWYKNYACFTSGGAATFHRGGNSASGSDSGQFYFNINGKITSDALGFRLVLAPQ